MLLTPAPGAGRAAPDADALLAWCAGLDCPDALGTACRLALPAGQGNKDRMLHAVLADLRAAVPNHPPGTPLARLLEERVRDDFQERRIVSVDGWMLSQTETRLYALSVLLT